MLGPSPRSGPPASGAGSRLTCCPWGAEPLGRSLAAPGPGRLWTHEANWIPGGALFLRQSPTFFPTGPVWQVNTMSSHVGRPDKEMRMSVSAPASRLHGAPPGTPALAGSVTRGRPSLGGPLPCSGPLLHQFVKPSEKYMEAHYAVFFFFFNFS